MTVMFKGTMLIMGKDDNAACDLYVAMRAAVEKWEADGKPYSGQHA